jgi:glycogen debranching enzyme
VTSLSSTCEQVLRANDRGRYTVPAPHLYPHQWAWDSAFAAIGWAYLDAERAWTELRTLMATQWDDGRIPHIYFHQPSADYYPGPAQWKSARSSSITQPPMWAIAARHVVEISGHRDPARELLPAMEASHRFFRRQRDPLGWGLVAVAHPWESGCDNSPAWDEPLARVDVSKAPAIRRRDTTAVGDDSVRPTDDDYLRYMALVEAIAGDQFGPGPFAVYDPMMSAVLARAERDLAWLAERCGYETDAARRADAIQSALANRLWDETAGRFRYLDAGTGRAIDADVIGCYAPLWCGIAPALSQRLVEGLRERYDAAWPLPSTSPRDPAFDPRRYWRGPAWVNVNWLFVDAIGSPLAERTLELVRRHGCREYYHPSTGEGLGAKQFSWTAALVLDLLARGYR